MDRERVWERGGGGGAKAARVNLFGREGGDLVWRYMEALFPCAVFIYLSEPRSGWERRWNALSERASERNGKENCPKNQRFPRCECVSEVYRAMAGHVMSVVPSHAMPCVMCHAMM